MHDAAESVLACDDVAKGAATALPEGHVLAVLNCPGCGYDLKVTGSNQCPECGESVDLETIKQWQMPWQTAKGFGHVGAFFKTAVRVTVGHKQTAWAANLPVDLKKARWFRRLVCLWVWAFVGVFSLVPRLVSEWEDLSVDGVFGFGLTGFWLIAVGVSLGLLLGLFAVTGLHLVGFHPKSQTFQQQNRSVALAHYACAPLVWVFLPMVAIPLAGVVGSLFHSRDTEEVFWPIGMWAIVLLLFFMQLRAVGLWMKTLFHRGGFVRAAWFVGLLVGSVVLLFVCLLGLPFWGALAAMLVQVIVG